MVNHLLTFQESFGFLSDVNRFHEARDVFHVLGKLSAAHKNQGQKKLEGMLVLEVGLNHHFCIRVEQFILDEPVEESTTASDGFGGDEGIQRGVLREELLEESEDEVELEEVVD